MVDFKISGQAVKTPKKFHVTLNTIDADSSGRNAAGDMVRDILAQKVKIELEWGPMSQAEISTLLKLVQPMFFTVNYLDPKDGQVERTFYVGDRSTPVFSWNETFKKHMWENLTMNFIER